MPVRCSIQSTRSLLVCVAWDLIMPIVREAHVHSHILFSPVAIYYSTHHAASLGDPVVLTHPHQRADMCFFWLHDVAPPSQ